MGRPMSADLSTFEDYEMRSETGGYDWTLLDLDTIKEAHAEALLNLDDFVCVGIPSSTEVSAPIGWVENLIAARKQVGR